MIKLVYKNGTQTAAYYVLCAVERDRSEDGYAATWKSGDHTRLEALRQNGFVTECCGPRGGKRYKITKAGREALAAIAKAA